MAINVQKYIFGQRITEVGLAIWRGSALAEPAHQLQPTEFIHFKTSEHLEKQNGRLRGRSYNHKNDFFGASITRSLPEIGQFLMDKLVKLQTHGEVILVVHGGWNPGGWQQLADLESIGCRFHGLRLLDTQKISYAVRGGPLQVSLRDLVRSYDGELQIAPFNNAGNNAFYTLFVLGCMAKIDIRDENEDVVNGKDELAW